MAIETGCIPPTINCKQPDAALGVNVVREATSRPVKVAITVGYALGGGQYGAIVLKRQD